MNIRKNITLALTVAVASVALTGCVFTPASSAQILPAEHSQTPQSTPKTEAEQPVTNEDRYLQAAMDGITYASVPSNIEDMIVDMGYLTCDAWDEGASRSMLIAVVDSGLGDSIGFTPDAAAIFVDAALNHLC